MAAVALDSIDYAHQLEAAGMPRQQAEVVAKGLTTMLVHNFDTLVTKDYLDIRFSEFETRVEAKMDRHFAEVDMHLVEFRAEVRGEISDLRGTLKLHSWMFPVLIAGIFIPLMQKLVA